MREYYRVFGRKIKSLPLEPVFTDYYHPSEISKERRYGYHWWNNLSVLYYGMEVL